MAGPELEASYCLGPQSPGTGWIEVIRKVRIAAPVVVAEPVAVALALGVALSTNEPRISTR